MEISFLCPHCGAAQLANERSIGQIGVCTACGQSTEIPKSTPMAMPPLVIEDRVERRHYFAWGAVLLLVIFLGGACVFSGSFFDGGNRFPRRSQTSNNMHNLMIALHIYHDQHGELPPAVVYDKNGKPMHSWRVLILPYIEENNRYQQYDFSKPWDAPENLRLAETVPSLFCSPYDTTARKTNQTSYLLVTGKGSFLNGPGKHTMSDLEETDGKGATVGLVEVDQSGVLWTQPTDLDASQLDYLIHDLKNAKPGQINSAAPEGTMTALYDGSTRFISNKTPPEKLKSYIDPRDGKGFSYDDP